MLRNPRTPRAWALNVIVGLAGGLAVVAAIAVALGQDVGDSIAVGLVGAFAVGLVYIARWYARTHRAHRSR